MRPSTKQNRGFTLVELLVVIAIIATLAALLTPAVMAAIAAAKNGALKLEVTKIEKGIESYKNKFGDYPPDFSDSAIVLRHYRKLFPKMSVEDSNLLNYILDPDNVEIDRAEALFFVLHGYSSDPTHPFSGPGGPLDATTFSGGNVDTLGGSTGMTNNLIEFEEPKISWDLSGGSYVSNDDATADVFATYRQAYADTPFVYFDQRTYYYNDPDEGWVINEFTDQNNSLAGFAHPYKTDQGKPKPDGNEENVWQVLPDGRKPHELKFANANTFQIIAAGLDGKFSPLTIDTVPDPVDARVHPTGINYKTEDNDNIANFSTNSSLEGDLP